MKKGRNIIGDIVTMGIPIVSVIIALIRVIESTAYAMQCSEIYGADIRYFINTGLTEVRVIYVVSTFIIILHPIIIVYFFKNNKQWKWKVLIWLLIALWGQTVVYAVNIKKATLWNTGIIGFMMCAGFVADGIIDYLIFKIFFTESEIVMNGIRKGICCIALFIYAIICFLEIAASFNGIRGKKVYETINDNKAIIAEYNDKFIVIDCYIEGENLVLLKGNYTIEDLTGVKIKRRKYEMIFTID